VEAQAKFPSNLWTILKALLFHWLLGLVPCTVDVCPTYQFFLIAHCIMVRAALAAL
jgi:hypothetical protein